MFYFKSWKYAINKKQAFDVNYIHRKPPSYLDKIKNNVSETIAKMEWKIFVFLANLLCKHQRI